MPHLVSIILDSLDVLDPERRHTHINGAHIAMNDMICAMVSNSDVVALEVFVPPSFLIDVARLNRCATGILKPELMGKNRLRFHPIHAIPYIWADGEPRILYCPLPEALYKHRYVRDRFARGTMPVTSDSHSFGMAQLMLPLARLAEAPPVPFDSIVASSEATRGTVTQILQDFSTRPDKSTSARVDLIPRSIDTEQFVPASENEKAEAREELGLPESGQILLYFGRVTPHTKGDLSPLLRSFQAATTTTTDYLVIAGEEEPEGYRAHLVSEAQSLGIADRVVFHGRVEAADRHKYFAASDMFVLPSDTIIETLGLTVLEAMATGLPCIVSDWDGLRDTVVEGETGFKIPTWWMPAQDRVTALSSVSDFRTDSLLVAQNVWIDTDRLAETIKILLRDPELRGTMGKKGRRRVEESYAQSKILERWISLWNELTEMAGKESPEEKQRRFHYAPHLGAPIDYIRQYSRYASNIIDPEHNTVTVTEYGKSIIQARSTVLFYQDLAPLIAPPAFGSIMTLLERAAGEAVTIQLLVNTAAEATKIPHDDLRFVVGLLLKQGIVTLGGDGTLP